MSWPATYTPFCANFCFFNDFLVILRSFPSPINRWEGLAILFTKIVKSSQTLPKFPLQKPNPRKERKKRENQKFKRKTLGGVVGFHIEPSQSWKKILVPIRQRGRLWERKRGKEKVKEGSAWRCGRTCGGLIKWPEKFWSPIARGRLVVECQGEREKKWTKP